MTIVDVYSRQYRWRSWPTIIDFLPNLDGQFVLDLGCGIGDLAADLSARGASVVGVDINQEVVTYANNRHIANAEFRHSDLHTFRDPSLCVDGIWSSFTAAYFPAFRDTLPAWIEHLRPGGWLALTETTTIARLPYNAVLQSTMTQRPTRPTNKRMNRSRNDVARSLRSSTSTPGLVIHTFSFGEEAMSAIGSLAMILWLAISLAAWWFAIWFAIGRREHFVVPFLGVLVLGLGLPITVADLIVVTGHGGWQGPAIACWTAVPLVTIGCHLAIARRRTGGQQARNNADV